MKKEYKTPFAEVVVVNTTAILQDNDQDSTGNIPGDDPSILGNESFLFEDDGNSGPSKNLWE